MRIPAKLKQITFYLAKTDFEAYSAYDSYKEALASFQDKKTANPEFSIYGIVKVNKNGHLVYIVN